MTTTTVSDAVILPQSQGTGLSGENATIDAAINGVLNRYVGGEYVDTTYSTGLAFQNHDGTNDTVEVGPGIVFIQDNSTSTGGERSSGGNPQAESSTTSGYDTELPEGHTYAVLFPTATQISVSDSTLNEVYVDIDDVTANNSVNLEHDGSTTASPSNTSLKIGETNPDDASADTRTNDDATPTFSGLTVNGTTDTDALNAGSVDIGNFVSSGDFVPLVTFGPNEQRTFSTTGTSYTNNLDWAAFIVNWDDNIPENGQPAVSYSIFEQGGNQLDVRLQNVTDGETVFEETGVNGVETGVVNYNAASTGRLFFNWEIKSPDGSTQTGDRPMAALGVQL